MMPTIDHEEARELLPDFVDDELTGDERSAVAEHVDRCAQCRQEVAELRDLIGHAQELPTQIPTERDLWPAIAVRLRPSAERAGCAAEPGGLGTLGRLWSAFSRPVVLWPSIAAATAVLVLALWIPRQQESPDSVLPEIDFTTRSVLAALESECREGESQVLAAAEETPDGELGGTWNLIVANLRTIDLAIQDARDAWRANPRSPHLTRMVIAAYRAKSSLLGDARRLVENT